MAPAAIPRYLMVPLRTAPLLVIAVFSVLLTVAARAGLMGLPLALILSSWFLKYAFVLLDHVADGVTEPPALSVEMVNPVEQRSFVLLMLAIGLYSLSAAISASVGPRFATAVALTGAMVLPAVVAVQGATGSIFPSFNPRTCFGLILRLRGDYVLILACIVLCWLLAQVIVVSALGNMLPLVARIALLMYAWFAIFALIGGVLFERRHDIGLDASHAPERLDMKVDREVDRVRDRQVDLIYAEWRGGARGNAWQTITAQVEKSADPLLELRWMYQRISRWPDQRLAGRLAQELLPKLLAKRQVGEALDMVRERLEADAAFRPLGSADLLTLVRVARDAGDRPTARALLHDFGRFYPNDAALATVEILSRQLAR